MKTNETVVFAGRHMNLENLENLDPVQNAQLYYQYICNSIPTKSTLKYIYRFVKNYHPSIFKFLRLEDIKSLGKTLDELAFKENAHINILKILKELIKKIQTSPHNLTFLHPIFAKHCLLAKTYSYAKDILSYDIEDFDSHVNILDFLLYHYYGGMLAIGLSDYNKALTYFRRVISSPCEKVASAIMIESYKKYVLVSILLHGKKQQLPSYTDDDVYKNLSKSEHCKKYKDLENSFSSLSSEMNMNVIRIKKLSNFKSKNNKGLVKQTTRAYTRKVIQKLTQTYVTMSFEEIAKEIGLEGENANKIVERHLLSMIENNEIFAYINHSNGGMVSFYDDPERYNNNDTMEKINDCIKAISELNDKVLEYNSIINKKHIVDATKRMKEIKKNIDKTVSNEDSIEQGFEFPGVLMGLDEYNISDDDNERDFRI
ncbi:hypothetical protein BCR36DRAFT_584044 [Piromyces finnis]|uniref:COP9 signalosome complex subunit 3 n=1 Tax=Piromyces finnis TaxID=1754191 RepID=A0A1Y1V7E3_9FUNG|nr:hypothetical protein BCR36DRAFT_584044 [Piromyces finnis]|eukprot:ORX48928.1 hypothetical protein BCR36DRAFT_584044 [Piromyces finnis]